MSSSPSPSGSPPSPRGDDGPAAEPPPAPHGLLARIADLCVRRRRAVVVGWIVALVVIAGAGSGLAGDYAADYSTKGADSTRADDLVTQRLSDRSSTGITIVWQDPAGAGSAAAERRIAGLVAEAGRLEGVGAPGATRISRDGTIGTLDLNLTEDPWNVPKATGEKLIAAAEKAQGDGLRIELGGGPIQDAEGGASPELVSLIAAAAILVVAFGSLVAAGLPLLVALVGLGLTMSLIGILTNAVDVPEWAPAVASLMGIGVGIDYALLIITRFRAALARRDDVPAAVREAVSTAGRSTLIAGSTVVIALLGLFLMRVSYMNGVALAACIAVLVVMAASLTLVPALLAMLGHRIEKLHVPVLRRRAGLAEGEDGTLAGRWARTVQRRPWPAAIVAALVLLLLTAPVLGLRFGFPDAGNDRSGTTTREAYDLVTTGFGAGSNGPLLLVAENADGATLRRVASAARRDRDVAAVLPADRARDGSVAAITVFPRSSPQDERTVQLVHRMRDDVLPAVTRGTGATVLVGGLTASVIDQSDQVGSRLPLFIAGVVVLALLLLLVAFRAPLVALKAGVMNLLSVGAAYGVVSLAAQGGMIGQLVGIDTETPVPPFIPVMMFAILFGLSMDYEVFLLSRIRERFRLHGDTSRAVTEGLAGTARVITAAAAIMVAVFSAFLLSPETFLKLMGLGMATAIFVDATVVRMVLVPAVMQLMGRWNWWIPDWLDRRLPDLEHRDREPLAAEPA